MLKKIIFNAVIIIVLIMIALAVIKANRPKSGALKAVLSNTENPGSNVSQREAKYYRVISE